MGSTDLHVELVGDALESRPVLHQVGKVDVDGGAEGCSKVGWARSDVTELVVVSERGNTLDVGCSLRQSCEDCTDVSTLLHRDDSKLILLVDPDEEGLLVVVEDASAFRPVSVEVASIQESVSLLEKEVIVDQLLLLGWSHGAEGVECASELTCESVTGLDYLLFNLVPLLSRDSWAKRELS